MSDSSAATPSGPASPQVVAYLTSQLARNPIHQSGDIVSHRAKAFKLAPKPNSHSAVAASASVDHRPKLREKLEKIRSACFTAPVDKSLASLDKLDLASFPDLAALAGRLRVILKSRSALPQLSGHPKFDGDFFSCLKKVLVSPPRDVSVLREQVLASFRHRKNRKRGQAMVKLLKAELPELYALESDWLESLLRYSPRREASATAGRGSASTGSSGSYVWTIWLVLAVAGGAARGCADNENKSARDKTPNRSKYSSPNGVGGFGSTPTPSGNFGGFSESISPSPQLLEQSRAFDRIKEQQERMKAAREQSRPRGTGPNSAIPGVPDSKSIFGDPYPEVGRDPLPSFSPPTAPSPGRFRYQSP